MFKTLISLICLTSFAMGQYLKPDTPVTIFPKQGTRASTFVQANDTTTLVTLRWYKPTTNGVKYTADYVLKYYIYVSTDSLNAAYGTGNCKIDSTNDTFKVIILKAPATSTKYYWSTRNISVTNVLTNASTLFFKYPINNFTHSTILTLNSVANNTINVPLDTVRFNWSKIIDHDPFWTSCKYEVQIALDSNFTGIAVPNKKMGDLWDTICADTTCKFTKAMSYISNYNVFWHVRPIAGSIIGNWSNVYKFTTALKTVIQVSPLNTQNADTVINFTWRKSIDSLSFVPDTIIQYDFRLIGIDTVSIVDTFITIRNLSYNTIYYWQVRAIGTNGKISGWSNLKYVKTKMSPVPVAPILIYNPITTKPVYLYWHKTDSAKKYEFQLYTTTNVLIDTILTDTSFSSNNINNSISYLWKVRAINGIHVGPWSSPLSFYSRFVPILTHIQSSFNKRPTFIWSNVDTAYTLTVYSISNSIRTTIINGVVKDTSYIPFIDLPTNTLLYWNVAGISRGPIVSVTDSFVIISIRLNHITSTLNKRPTFSWTKTDTLYTLQFDTTKTFSPLKNISIKDTFYTPLSDLPSKTIYWRVSDSREFTSIDSFTIFPMLFINHIASSTNRRPIFSWSKTDINYTLQFDTTKTFSGIITLADTFFIPVNDLPYKTIYWHVADSRGFSNIDSFTVYKPLVLNRIASSTNRKPVFSWNKIDTSYTLQIDTSKSFSTLIKNVTVKDTFCITATDLPIKTIYWRVFDSHGTSAIDSFTIKNGVSILNSENSCSSYKIITYKNSISIFLHNSKASLTIFNIKGQMLKYISSNNNIIFKYETAGAYISIIKVNNQIFKKLNIIQ